MIFLWCELWWIVKYDNISVIYCNFYCYIFYGVFLSYTAKIYVNADVRYHRCILNNTNSLSLIDILTTDKGYVSK